MIACDVRCKSCWDTGWCVFEMDSGAVDERQCTDCWPEPEPVDDPVRFWNGVALAFAVSAAFWTAVLWLYVVFS